MQRLKTIYLKTRVIQLVPELPFIMADMVQQPHEEYHKTDNLKNPMAYEQAIFLAQCVKKWKIDDHLFNPVEKHYYTKSVEQLNRFYDLHQFITQLEELNTNVHYLYLTLSNDQSASNIASYAKETSEKVADQLNDTIAEYNRLDKQLHDYPEWQSKLREETGRYINLIYTLHIENPALEEILGNFDRHQYFK